MSISKIAAGLVAASILVPSAAFAQSQTSTGVQQLLDLIHSLDAQLRSMQQQQATIVQQQSVAVQQLVTTLKQGSVGDQVTALQSMLSLDPSLYPEKLVTGVFGKLTAAAVKRFQKKYGLPQVGHVGPQTLKKLNSIFGSATSTWSHGNGAGGDVDDNDRNPGIGKVTICHKPGKGNVTIFVGGPSVTMHLKHGDHLGSCSGSGNGGGGTGTTTPPVTPPDTIAPTISGATVVSVNSAGGTVQWVTNEAATSRVEYGTSTAYGSFTTLDTTLVTSHNVVLAGLAPLTVYHARVYSKDAAGNQAISNDIVFTTTAIPDLTAPTISGITAESVSPTSETILWATDEVGNSGVNYGTTTLYGGSTVDNALVTAHTMVLTGLDASTVYHFRVTSKDGAGNNATSSDVTFLTANADVTAPVLSGIVANAISATSATIEWATDEGATSKVEFGITALYGSATTLDTNLLTSHSQPITGLTASTLYHFHVISKDAAGNTATSSDTTFTTLSAADTIAPTLSGAAATNITSTGATIQWSASEPATSQVAFGASASYGTYTTLDTTLVPTSSQHNVALTGLTPSTLYHFAAISKDASGNTATTSDVTFTTLGADTTPPVISNVGAATSSTAAEVTWTTDELSTSKVYYSNSGPVSTGSQNATNLSLVTSHSVTLTGLTSNSTYFYIVESTDASSNTATTTSAMSFTTNP